MNRPSFSPWQGLQEPMSNDHSLGSFLKPFCLNSRLCYLLHKFERCFLCIQWNKRCYKKLWGVDYTWPHMRDVLFLSMESIHKPVMTGLNILSKKHMYVCVGEARWVSLMIRHYFKLLRILWYHDPIIDTIIQLIGEVGHILWLDFWHFYILQYPKLLSREFIIMRQKTQRSLKPPKNTLTRKATKLISNCLNNLVLRQRQRKEISLSILTIYSSHQFLKHDIWLKRILLSGFLGWCNKNIIIEVGA